MVHQAQKCRAEKGFSAERKGATRSLRYPVDSMGSRVPNSITQAKEKAWPSFSCMQRNLPDEFIRVGSQANCSNFMFAAGLSKVTHVFVLLAFL